VTVGDIHAGWITLGALALALVLLVVFGIRAWRAVASFNQTKRAAQALIDVHTERLEATIVTAGSSVSRVADHSTEVVTAITDLRANAGHLTWMLRRVPEERDRLQRELLEVLLPTAKRADD